MEVNISRPFDHNISRKNFTNRSQGEDFDEMHYYTTAICVAVNVLLCFTSLFGNCAILITLWKTASLHSPANILLASLAVSDLAVGLVLQPFYITVLLNNFTNRFVIYFDIFTAFLCFASFCTTAAIGVDRLLALQLHLRYKAEVTPFRVTGVVSLIWVYSGLISSTRLWNTGLFYHALASSVFVVLLVNFGVYLRIYTIARRHQLQITHQEQHHQGHDANIFWKLQKSAVNTFLVYVVLLFCYA